MSREEREALFRRGQDAVWRLQKSRDWSLSLADERRLASAKARSQSRHVTGRGDLKRRQTANLWDATHPDAERVRTRPKTTFKLQRQRTAESIHAAQLDTLTRQFCNRLELTS